MREAHLGGGLGGRSVSWGRLGNGSALHPEGSGVPGEGGAEGEGQVET